MLGNLKPEHRSRLKDIHLLMLTKASDIRKYGYEKIMYPLLQDLKSLETNGITVEFDEHLCKFFGTVSMIVADNLALGVFYEKFSTVKRFCRQCNRVKSAINDVNCIDVIRSREAYDNQICEIEKDPSLIPFYGIKKRCILNELAYFHIMDGAPGDIAHDVFEGFAPDYLCQLLVYFIKNNYFSINDINERIYNFEYADIDKTNKPQPLKEKPLSTFKIKQTACEMWNLLRLFPVVWWFY